MRLAARVCFAQEAEIFRPQFDGRRNMFWRMQHDVGIRCVKRRLEQGVVYGFEKCLGLDALLGLRRQRLRRANESWR